MIRGQPFDVILTEYGITTLELAKSLGIHPEGVRHWRRGHRRITATLAAETERQFGIPRWRLRPDLWDQPETNGQEPTATVQTAGAADSSTLRELVIEEIDGEPRVRDVVLGVALGYSRPRKIRDLIERLMGPLLELGSAPHRGAMVSIGSGALREVTEYLLNQAQINYLIMRSDLPNADQWCIHIARVFTAWQSGKLTATDLHTAVELQDSQEGAASAVPDLAALHRGLIDLNARLVAVERQNARIEQGIYSIDKKVSSKRGYIKAETIRQLFETLEAGYDGYCPCGCRTRILIDGNSVGANVDHWLDHPAKSEPHQVWIIAGKCNQEFETKKRSRLDYQDEFNVFQKRRRRLLEAKQPPLLP